MDPSCTHCVSHESWESWEEARYAGEFLPVDGPGFGVEESGVARM